MKEIEKEFEISDEDSPEKSSAIELGNRLRAAREAKNLDYRDLTETTRLRPRFLEALERGDWDALPSVALARGFVSTYARALGLDAARLIERHSDALPDRKSPFSGIVIKKEPARRRKPLFFLICLVGMGLVGGGLLVWFGGGAPEISSEPENAAPPVVQTEPPSPDSESGEDAGKPGPERRGPAGEDDVAQGPSELESATEADAPKLSEPDVVAPGGIPEELPGPESPVPGERAREPETRPAEGSGRAAGGTVEKADDKAEKMPLTLKAYVRERTWMRVSVDDGEPREYIFSPGNEPEWEAQATFDLLIGNAGGLVLELNGERMDALGASGQVVRVRLPETRG
jgi:cytoskeleton protein RodZ